MATLDNRYTINGLLDTAQTVMQNLEEICATCNTWLTYDSTAGKWSFVVNQAGTPVTDFDDDNILGGINLSTAESDAFYNQCEVRYRNKELRDQEDYVLLQIPANQRLVNEPDNRLIIDAPLVNNQIQAQIIGLIELKQSRQEQIIEFTTDYSQIGLDAGDIVRVTNTVYGFNQREFRVLRMIEREENNSIVIQITAQEYDPAVYDLSDLFEFISETGDGVFVFDPLRDSPPLTPFTQVVDETGASIGNFGDFGELTGLLAGVAATGLLNSMFSDGDSVTGDVEMVAGDNMSIVADAATNTLTFASTGGGGGGPVSGVQFQIQDILQNDPGIVTTTTFNTFATGDLVIFSDILGSPGSMADLNGQQLFVSVLVQDSFSLFFDADLTIPFDTTALTEYVGGGTVARVDPLPPGGPYTPLLLGSSGGGLVVNQTKNNMTFDANNPRSVFKIDATSNIILSVTIGINTAEFGGLCDGTDPTASFRSRLSIVNMGGQIIGPSTGFPFNNPDEFRTVRFLRLTDTQHLFLSVPGLPAGQYGVQIGGQAGSFTNSGNPLINLEMSWIVHFAYSTNPF